MPPTIRSYQVFAFIMLTASLFGCSTAPAKPALMANMAKSDLTVAQLRAIDYSFASHFGELVAACVTDIVEQTTDSQMRERAYQWRMWASPQARAAAFDQDPFAGFVELWALAGQQRQFFTEGLGSSYFGDEQGRALETTAHLENMVEEIASTVVTERHLERMTNNVHTWVREHPIEGQLFVRPSARADLAKLVPEQTQGGLKAVGSIDETFRDLNDRLTILTVQMPVEARWQAEYLTQSLFEERLQEPADSLVAAAGNITDFLGEFEMVIDGEISTLLDAIERERLAVFEAVGEERAMILEAIKRERVSVMTKLDQQLIAATTELDTVGRGLIDHFFVRLIEVLAVVGLVMILTVLLVLVVLRKRGSSND